MSHVEIFRFLLEKGADINARGGAYGNALYAASWFGHLEIVQVLLKNGVNINAHGGYYGNALCTASYKGHLSIVRVLIEKVPISMIKAETMAVLFAPLHLPVALILSSSSSKKAPISMLRADAMEMPSVPL